MTSVGRDGTVEFWFYRKGVRQVRVVGDFADWRGGGLDMCDRGDGWWRLSTRLDSGEYRFRYVADGQWYTDYASNGIEMDKAGVNSLLVVPERGLYPAPTEVAKMVA
jgi:1,4-alpha-glucan branching enzyme